MLFVTFAVGLLALVSGAQSACDVTHQQYYAGDGTVLVEAANIVTVKAKCSNGEVPIYAAIDGKVIPLSKNADGSLQVSWTDSMETAGSGSYRIHFYDEASFKKAEYVKFYKGDELFAVNVSHSSPYRGPLVQLEVGALFVFLVAAYYAIAGRCGLSCSASSNSKAN